MKFKEIEWKNVFAYGEEIQKIEYIDGELVLLKGISGSGKSAILSLPSLLLYGKLTKLTKSSIANRTNKNAWIRGIIEKGQHTYIIERTFSPNNLLVFKDGVNIDSYGTSSAQDYIDNEIADIPLPVFSNMISISMKKFKSFLTMTPADRKQIIDRVFNLELINIAFEKIKKDIKEISISINNSNATKFQLEQTLNYAINQLTELKSKSLTDTNKEEIEQNLEKIKEIQNNINNLTQNYNNNIVEQNNITTKINSIKQQQYENIYNINTINEKIQLFSQDKCPTCGTNFSTNTYKELKEKLIALKNQKEEINVKLNNELNDVNKVYNDLYNGNISINNEILNLKNAINVLLNRNNSIEEQFKLSNEYTGIQKIIDNTTVQIQTVVDTISNLSLQQNDLLKLQIVYSIDGVKQKVITNYLPILNQEIANNLELLNFPYQLELDSKFEPHLKELGIELDPETLSDGEETRVDLVILCSLFKLLKRRFPTINILSIDEVISSLDNESSGLVLDFLKTFSKDNNLSCFIVSHTDLYLDNFDKIINVIKNGFSRIEITKPCN